MNTALKQITNKRLKADEFDTNVEPKKMAGLQVWKKKCLEV